MSQRGSTMLELVTVLAVMGILAAVAVPSAAGTHRTLASATAARELALLLRSAQARAQMQAAPVRVQVAGDGRYEVSDGTAGEPWARGSLGAPVQTNYPGGAVEFGARGWPLLAGTTTPRAGSFTVGAGGRITVVVVQLAGCIRCR